MPQCKPKWDTEDELDLVVLPEIRPPVNSLIESSAKRRLVTEPLKFEFVVDTGPMVSLIKPDISKAQLRAYDMRVRGVPGTYVLGVN